MKGTLAQHLKSLHESVVKEVQKKYKSPLKATVTHASIDFHDVEMDTTLIVNLRQVERNGGYDIASDFRSAHVTIEENLRVLVYTIVSLLEESKQKMSRYASNVPSKYLKTANFKKSNKKFMKVLGNMLMEKVDRGELVYGHVQDAIDIYGSSKSVDVVAKWEKVIPQYLLRTLTPAQKKRLSFKDYFYN